MLAYLLQKLCLCFQYADFPDEYEEADIKIRTKAPGKKEKKGKKLDIQVMFLIFSFVKYDRERLYVSLFIYLFI